MKIRLTRRSGFCFGVRRAIQIAEGSVAKYRKVFSLGPIIHNSQVVEQFRKLGLTTVGDISKIKKGTVLITSHGMSPEVVGRLTQRGLRVIDTTCPFVAHAQRLAKRMRDKGYHLVIVGQLEHPEVKSLVGFAKNHATVIHTVREAKRLRIMPFEKVCVLSQTTQSLSGYLDIARELLSKNCREMRVFNTICDDTKIRQKQAEEIADTVTCMIVVGGRNSANTNRLLRVSKERLRNSHLVETERDIDPRWFSKTRSVGIASGASTPDWIIDRVIKAIQRK